MLLFAPFIGQKLDASRRSGLFVWTLLLVQVMSIALSGLLLSVAFWTGTSIIGGWAFGVLLALQMVEKLSAVTSEVAIERDWITRICGKGNTAGLAHGNSMIRRFDLVCDFVGTVGVGVIIDRLGVGAAVWYCVLMSILSWPVINSRLRLLNIDGEGEAPKTDDKMRQVTMSAKERNTIRVYFFDNPMLFSSLVVVLLYFNVALSPGGILSAYLIHCDVTGTGLAMFRGACAIMGFLGSLVGKALINARGLMPAGRIRYVAMIRVEFDGSIDPAAAPLQPPLPPPLLTSSRQSPPITCQPYLCGGHPRHKLASSSRIRLALRSAHLRIPYGGTRCTRPLSLSFDDEFTLTPSLPPPPSPLLSPDLGFRQRERPAVPARNQKLRAEWPRRHRGRPLLRRRNNDVWLGRGPRQGGRGRVVRLARLPGLDHGRRRLDRLLWVLPERAGYAAINE